MLAALAAYADRSSSSSEEEEEEEIQTEKPKEIPEHLKPLESEPGSSFALQVVSAPDISLNRGLDPVGQPIDPKCKELTFNPKYEQLFAPDVGPKNPFKTGQKAATRNTLAGYVEKAHLNEFHFENQRRTFTSYGYAIDPSSTATNSQMIGQPTSAESSKTVFETIPLRPKDKRKRDRNDKPEDIDGYLGPWAPYEDLQTVAKPTEEESAELEVILSKRQRRGKNVDDKPIEEKSIVHIKDTVDYQGRSFMVAGPETGGKQKAVTKCFIPKNLVHTWTAHTKGCSAIRLFPNSGHLLLSSGMDTKVKLWEVYGERRCLLTYMGHRQAVRDICFNRDGTRFLSAAYDRFIKLWDTETGQVIKRFSNRKIPYCVKFHPEVSRQHLFVAGTSDKKIVCWDTRSGDICQEYDRHLGAVNTITFVDENRRFVSTSDDKSLRVWEWDIPVDMKYIADPSMHSMPAVTMAPNGKWLACQSMDNKVMVFTAMNRFKLHRKKTFSGHMVAGYACQLDFSPDMSYLISGDADGKVFVWDWKSTQVFSKWKAHDNTCISVLWHPNETSKIISAGWDGLIKLWD